MKVKSAIILIVVILITAGLGWVAYFGLNIGGKQIVPGVNGIRKGLDVAGGVRIIYTIEGEDPNGEGMAKTEKILRNRLDQKGLNEATVRIDAVNPNNQMIIVEIPGFDDPEEASEFLGKTAKLRFVEPDGKVVMEGDDIVDATAEYGPVSDSALKSNEYYIRLTISPEAKVKFEEATGRLASSDQNYIAIVLDDQILSYPTVEERISTTVPIITGKYTYEEAKETADLISSGALPFTLKTQSQEYIGPTIGHAALIVTVRAGIIAFFVILLLLLLVYRVPGLVSAIALCLYTAIFILIYELGNITVTLPGIAGIILSIAMAVDASVITYERLREELKTGKTLKTAIERAFSKAFLTVRDSNITTIISAVILLVIGTGSVQGFGMSLLIGIILSFIMAVFLLKFLLKNLTNIITSKNYALCYGVKREEKKSK